ncbi:MAG: glycoside hydrolase family 127 protein [Pirellulales bacterium]|nr:glycoside hydrolase family 127 protein [Pirellulales bacterium]
MPTIRRAVVCWVVPCIVLAGLSATAGLVRGEEDTPAAAPRHRALAAVPFTAVAVQDAFWAPKLRTNREVSLPHNFEWCEKTGRIANFAKAGKLVEGKFEGIYFNDSDVYKVIEGASYSLADHPDPALEKMVDDVIAKIAAAQQPDGYLNTYYTLVEPGKQWTNCRQRHELYCAGHLIEAAVAHHRATGKRTLLDVALKLAAHIDGVFGPGKKIDVPGHEEIELALVKLYELTGEERWLRLANFFLDLRGDRSRREIYGEYMQDHMPIRQQSEIVGHAVRAMYLYSGVADVASYTGDAGYVAAMDRLWKDVALRKMYLTGGIGARHEGEAFGDAYELPNASAYAETCAAVGMILWNHRLNLLHGDAKYVDVLERTLYNGFLSGVAADGKTFFYVNPLASAGNHHRQPFFDCACCPPNVIRTLPSLSGYVYACSGDRLRVNLYVASRATVTVAGQPVAITQKTDYPWDGKVTLRVDPAQAAEFEIGLRIPEWCGRSTFRVVKGEPVAETTHEKGYLLVRRTWKPGDVVELDMPMEIRRTEAHPCVAANAGRVALERGPIVYCFEGVDNDGQVENIILPRDLKFVAQRRDDLLGGVVVLKGADVPGRTIAAVPYYAWDNREPGPMAVWVRQDGKARRPYPGDLYRAVDPGTLNDATPWTTAELAVPSASHCWASDTPAALNDQVEPKNSSDQSVARLTFWDHRGTKEWAQYDFAQPQTVSSVAVYWFDDGRLGKHCRVPASWRVLYHNGDAWKPVQTADAYTTALDRYNRVTFAPVETTAVRLEIQLAAPWSGGVLEWKIE